jgi:hypothetical protein
MQRPMHFFVFACASMGSLGWGATNSGGATAISPARAAADTVPVMICGLWAALVGLARATWGGRVSTLVTLFSLVTDWSQICHRTGAIHHHCCCLWNTREAPLNNLCQYPHSRQEMRFMHHAIDCHMPSFGVWAVSDTLTRHAHRMQLPLRFDFGMDRLALQPST